MEKIIDPKDRLEEMLVREFGKMAEFECEKHGKYMARELANDCPECEKEKEKAEWIAEEKERRAAHLARRWARCGMPEKFCEVTLDDWIERTPYHKVVKDAARKFIARDTTRMLLIGNCGTGKTMLAAGIIGEISMQKRNGEYVVPVYSTSTRLIRSIRDTWKEREIGEQEAMDKYINAAVLVVDELGAGRCTEDDKLILSEILCDRYAAEMPTLLISNMTATQLKESVLDERAVDRMREGGDVIVMKWQSERGRDES